MTSPQHLAVTAEHYTPPEIVERARRTLGAIDLDPASNAIAQRVVRARTYYTADDDGLARPWHGRVVVNPPGDRTGGLVKAFWARAVAHAAAGGVVLWVGFNIQQLQSLQRARDRSRAPRSPLDYPTAIPATRIAWLRPDGSPGRSPPHGCYFTLLGGDTDTRHRFAGAFGDLGVVLNVGNGPSRGGLREIVLRHEIGC